MSSQARIRDFIVDELRWNGARNQLTGDYPLIDNDVLDSMGIFQVVTFVEDEYGIEVDDEDLVPDNFATLDAIARLVDGKNAP
ncbi:MAG: acyl carrier protein [Actinomycetota bacterium]|nr:acyl carrier protein [Actinomycetota bacterium]